MHSRTFVLAAAIAAFTSTSSLTAPEAFAYEATPWIVSLTCPGGVAAGVFIQASGTGVLEIQWRDRSDNAPTGPTHYSRKNQPPYPHTVHLDSRERRIAWRAVAFDTDAFAGTIAETRQSCGGYSRPI